MIIIIRYRYLSRVRRRYRRLKTEVVDVNYQWQMDLADMNKLRGYSHMYRYLLVVVDLYSRFAWVKPMKTKSANNTYAKFIAILHDEKHGERNDVVPKFVQADLGTEFQHIRRFNDFEGKRWKVFSTQNRDMKASMVEAFIGQLKLMISRVVNVLNDSDVGTYVTFLDAIVERYTESPHRG